MKTRIARILAGVLALVLASSLLIGCTGTTEEDGAAPTGTATVTVELSDANRTQFATTMSTLNDADVKDAAKVKAALIAAGMDQALADQIDDLVKAAADKGVTRQQMAQVVTNFRGNTQALAAALGQIQPPASPPAPAPTGTPAPASTPMASAQASCLETSVFVRYMEDARKRFPGNDMQSLHERITALIISMDTEFDKNPNLGYQSQRPDGVIKNPGSAGIAIAYTNNGSSRLTIPVVLDPAAGGIEKNWIPVPGFLDAAQGGSSATNGWGFWRVYTNLEMKSGFRAIRLCQPLNFN